MTAGLVMKMPRLAFRLTSGSFVVALAVSPAVGQAIWVDPRALPDLPLAPLTRDHVLPLAG